MFSTILMVNATYRSFFQQKHAFNPQNTLWLHYISQKISK